MRSGWTLLTMLAMQGVLRAPFLFGLLVAPLSLLGCGHVLRTPDGPRTPTVTFGANRVDPIVPPRSRRQSDVNCRLLTADSVPEAESFAIAASALVAHEAWTVRFRRNDHGARRTLRGLYVAAAAPLWLTGGRPTRQALALLATLDGAAAYGLEPRDYGVDRLSALASELVAARASSAACAAERRAQFDVTLSATALALVSDLHYGRIDPRAAGFDLGAPRADDLDLASVLRALAHADDVGRALASIEPRFYHYRLLEQALARYRQLEEGVPTLAPRVRQIELTLERWRWLPDFKTPPIIVNIPEFRLFAFRTTADRAADILQMDVIVGRTYPRNRTPVFVADMTSVIFRPYWDVPRSITVSEMLPQIRAKPGFLAAEHLEIVRSASDAAAALPPTPDNIDALAAGTARLRQRPGPDNALGLIKFVLPNANDVYLHSTPAQQLFRRQRRAFSHGCIRVSDPVALAAYVLRETPGNWTPEKIEAAMYGPESRRVRLARPIRVMILYGTVLAKEDGEVLFFNDIYGQDRRLEQLLGLAPLIKAGGSLHRPSASVPAAPLPRR